jgi:hypothetical protein
MRKQQMYSEANLRVRTAPPPIRLVSSVEDILAGVDSSTRTSEVSDLVDKNATAQAANNATAARLKQIFTRQADDALRQLVTNTEAMESTHSPARTEEPVAFKQWEQENEK